MSTRRRFLKDSALLGAGILLAPQALRATVTSSASGTAGAAISGTADAAISGTAGAAISGTAGSAFSVASSAAHSGSFTSCRPAPADRLFVSEKVDDLIRKTAKKIRDPKLAWQFENCFPCTLDTTTYFEVKDGKPDTYVITGDIDAMWLRDSSAQVFPYLRIAKEDKHLKEMLQGLIARQSRCIVKDPYANAFNKEDNGRGHQDDYTKMGPGIWERKWEVDSLCYPIRLAYHYWKTTGDASVFTSEWDKAMRAVYRTFREQQRPGGNQDSPYRFQRTSPVACETLMLSGYGNPVKYCGLICSSFRPSDDATILPFLIPSNMFAVVSLRQVAEIYKHVMHGGHEFANECLALAQEVDDAIKNIGTINHPTAGRIFAYEVDGYGNHYCMDDANVPSLLAAPYLGYCAQDDPVYLNTRKYIWSLNNPYYFEGKAIAGIGGPHQGQDNVWPMSLIVYALTTSDKKEIKRCIKAVSAVDANTGFVHETVHKDDPTNFTRSWFAWANTLFGELILDHVDLL